MKRIGLLLISFFLFVGVVSAQINQSYAQYVFDRYIETDSGLTLDSIRVYRAPDLRKEVKVPFDEDFTLDEESWIFFIDPTPDAKWSHPCQYVCVSQTTGSATIKMKSMFPVDLRDWELVNQEPMAKALDFSTRLISSGLFKSKKTNAVKNNAHAILISGGGYPYGNWQDGWNEISIMYQALTDLHGYQKENIKVLMADGDNPDVDMMIRFQYDGYLVSSPCDLDGDGESDINSACDRETVASAFNDLANKSTIDDDVFIYIVSHGGNNIVALYGDYQYLRAGTLASYLNRITAKSITVFLSACHSGSFIDDIKGENRTIVTSTSSEENGYVFSDNCDIGTFWEPFFYGITGTDLITGDDFDCDVNEDGKNDYEESFVHGIENDLYAQICKIGNDHSNPNFYTSKPISQTVDITAGSGMVISDDLLTASNGISNADITYQSSKMIVLKKGFSYKKSGEAHFAGIVGTFGNESSKAITPIEVEKVFDYVGLSRVDDLLSENEGVNVYPNPSDGIVFVTCRDDNKIRNVSVINAMGNVMMDESGSSNLLPLNLSHLQRGIYFVKVLTDSKTVTKKVELR